MCKKSSSIYEYSCFNRRNQDPFSVNDFFIIIHYTFNFKDCPKECDYMVFKTSVNSAKYPTDYYAGMLLAQSKVIAKFSHDFFLFLMIKMKTTIQKQKKYKMITF